jgi:hypothetical protein
MSWFHNVHYIPEGLHTSYPVSEVGAATGRADTPSSFVC